VVPKRVDPVEEQDSIIERSKGTVNVLRWLREMYRKLLFAGYFHNMIEQDHGPVKRITRQMPGFK
jgi:transposase-like protein